ncbi:MAG TPA: AarF/UbiB family protein [Vicinamibacterales bacterium]|nr:AarF/UbiB family protein [Vicinamibacterales bacterium]
MSETVEVLPASTAMGETLEVLPAPVAAHWVESPEETKRRLEAVARDVRELASAEGAADELLRLLTELGPVFAGFARFLATRADVTPAGLRADFARVADRVAPAPWPEIQEVVEAGWRRRIERVCVAFDEKPFETRFPTQSHRAWLSPTDAVVVTCIPRSFEARLDRELHLLPRLSTALAPALGGRHVFDLAVEEYRAHARRLLDLSADVTASDALVADARRFPPLRARRPHPRLSSRRVAVWDEVAAVPWDTPGLDVPETAASACRAWVRQALLGRAFPEEPSPADFIIAGRRQVALGGRLFTSLPTDAQMTLQTYLVAVAAGDPDLAIRYLKRELVPQRGVDGAGFERRIRHAWSVDSDAAGGSELLAQLLLHWRIAVEHGYQPKPRLVSFYRGCLAAVSAATAMGAEADVLRNTLETLQIRLIASQVETLTGVSPTTARSVREAGWRLITALASGPLAAERRADAAGPRMSVVGSLLLALAAIGLATPALIASGVTWADPVGAGLFAAIGALILFLILYRRHAP